MIKSQVVTLNVVYQDAEGIPPKNPPAEWDWDTLAHRNRAAVEVLAAGPLKSYPRPGEEE